MNEHGDRPGSRPGSRPERDEDSGTADSAAPGQHRAGLDPATLASRLRRPGPAPVQLWDPPYCGELDMRIARDGTWFHEGRPIRREALVQLFASVLKKEQGRYYLVTPVEKVGIQVDDCPFVACGAEWTGSGPELSLILTLNTGDRVTVDKAHPLTVSTLPDSEEPHPVVLVRNGLEALLSRNVFYQLVDAAESRSRDGRTCLGIYSKGEFFELGSYQG